MNVSVEDISACRKRLKIEIPATRVTETFEKVTDEFQREAKLPGFRPGKAPRAMVQKKYLKNIEEEMQRTLVPDAYKEAVQIRKLRVVSAPEIEDLKFQLGLSLSFSTVVELAPEFALPNYKGLAVKIQDDTVSDKEIDEAIDRLREQHSEFTDVTGRALEMGDFAVTSYIGTLDGKPITEIVPQARNLGENPQFWLWVKEDVFLPKFAEQCVGMNIGDKRDVTIAFPTDFPQEPLAGKTAVYSVELKQIKSRTLPELNDELAQKIAKMNVEELRKAARNELETEKKNKVNREQKNEIIQQLLSTTNFELPPTLVEDETRGAIHDIVAENQARGVPADLLEEKKQEIFTNASKGAQEMVKLNFIVQRIAEAESLKVDSNDVGRQVQMIAMQQRQPIEKVIETLRRNNGIARIELRLLNQKVLDFLLQEAKIS